MSIPSQRTVFMGTAEFAVPSLRALLSAGHEVVAVVTQPDKPQGRKQILVPSPVKQCAEELGLTVLQPRRVRAEPFQRKMFALAPDVLAVAAFGQIVPQSLLDLPRIAPINVHGSLLPKYRGAAPIQRALIAGESETGVTTIWMDATLDTGDTLLMESLPIAPDDTSGTLAQKLSEMGASLLLKTIEGLVQGSLSRTPQLGSLSTYAVMLELSDGAIRWEESAHLISARVRGVNPKPGAFAEINGRRVKVWMALETETSVEEREAGTLLAISKSPAGVLVAGGDSKAVLLTEVQPENGKRMSAGDWARGLRLVPGDRFSPVQLP